MASFAVEKFGPDQLLHLNVTQISERARAFQELARIPELTPLQPA
jgi:hypothetical protein